MCRTAEDSGRKTALTDLIGHYVYDTRARARHSSASSVESSVWDEWVQRAQTLRRVVSLNELRCQQDSTSRIAEE